MTTRVVRALEQDKELIEVLSGMPPGMPFAYKLHFWLHTLCGLVGDPDSVQVLLRERVHTFAGGDN
jgi:hypothetical protein